MSARSKERKRALDVLFAAEARDLHPMDLLDERLADPTATLGDYAQLLVSGVTDHLTGIDDVIAQHSIDWTLDRMPAVDRAILRIAVFELVYGDGGVDAPVIIDEAVELAKSLSTDDSPRFVNGILAAVMAIAPRLRAS